MGRLIDADKLKAALGITGTRNDFCLGMYLHDIEMIIDEQPVAYNVDSVLGELKKHRNAALWAGQDEAITYAKAINVVERGGVE